MSESEIITKTSQTELDTVASLINQEDGTQNTSSSSLMWWYFQNPSRSFSFLHLKKGGAIEGVATTNNFPFDINEKSLLAAMPQKVLTSDAVRGKGYFGRLYRQTESDNIAQGVDCFLTFTNAMSTPIFLEKFAYQRGISPSIFVVPAIFAFFSKPSYRLISRFDENYLSRDDLIRPANSLQKDAEYYKWRYFGYGFDQFKVLNLVGENSKNQGYVVLKRKIVMQVPLYVVMDIITHNYANVVSLLQEALKYAIRNLALGIMFIENSIIPYEPPFVFCMKRGNKLNFLVKGKTEELTSALSKIKFNWFAGDMDFF